MDVQTVSQAVVGRQIVLARASGQRDVLNEDCILEVLQHTGVSRITADQCQLGQETDKGEPIRKPSGFMSDCEDILDQLHKRCKGRGGQCSRPSGGTHQLCHGKIGRRAAIFQQELCEGVLIGLRNYLTRHRRMRNNEQFYTDGCGIMIDGDDDTRLHYCHDLADPDSQPSEAAEVHFANGAEYDVAGLLKPRWHERYVDDITGQPLSPELCKKARATDFDYFRRREVWTLRKVNEALTRTGKPPISVRWVEVSKGDDVNPKIRSRLVEREIRMKGEEAIFAPTPPLESRRMVLSHAAMRPPSSPMRRLRSGMARAPIGR